jgi:hypothetical protein
VLQVSVFIRHGARTPYAPLTCWNGYDTKWDCQLTSLMAPSLLGLGQSSSRDDVVGDDTSSSPQNNKHEYSNPPFLFEKIYDGLEQRQIDSGGDDGGGGGGGDGDEVNDETNNGTSSTSNVNVNVNVNENGLHGTCLTGQLIEQGFVQELANGRHLRQAYIGHGNADAEESGDPLFKSPLFTDLPYPDAIYIRSDDEERTLMSAQVLVSGIFDMRNRNNGGQQQQQQQQQQQTQKDKNIVVPIHTADYTRDIIAPHSAVCPKLGDLESAAFASKEYVAKMQSPAVQQLLTTAEHNLNWPRTDMDEGIDCLMTTYCSGRFDSLPAPVYDVYDTTSTTGSTSASSNGTDTDTTTTKKTTSATSTGVTDDDGSLFSSLEDFFVWNTTFGWNFNNGAFAKLAMAPLWADVLDVVSRLLSEQITSLEEMQDANLPLLSLYSGHDTTLLPLLMSLDIWEDDGSSWPPYASMLVLESHHISNLDTLPTSFAANYFPSGHAFRLLYNGQSLTHKLSFCRSDHHDEHTAEHDLCDLQKLVDHVRRNGLADRHRDCTSFAASNQTPFMERTVSVGGVFGICVAVIVVSVGVTFVVVNRYMSRHINSDNHGGTMYSGIDIRHGYDHHDNINGDNIPDSTHSAGWNGYLDTAVEVAGVTKQTNGANGNGNGNGNGNTLDTSNGKHGNDNGNGGYGSTHSKSKGDHPDLTVSVGILS